MMGMAKVKVVQGRMTRLVVQNTVEFKPTPGQKFPYSRAYMTGQEMTYIQASLTAGKLSGNGPFTQRCEQYFRDRYGFHAALMAPSCTDALEMAALLLDLEPGDEVIMPSFTFVSTASAFALRGVKIRFADSDPETGNIDPASVASLINEKTKALVIVHYAGVACDMHAIMPLVKAHNLKLVEDCAHAVDAYFEDKPLGTFGQLATFSFHETKNIISGEGGLLVVNDPELVAQAEIIREKGTDRQAFLRGEVDKYTWRSLGSSFLAPDYVAAFLWAQLENLDYIQSSRLAVWSQYAERLEILEKEGHVRLPVISEGADHNAHIFYMLTKDNDTRTDLLAHLKQFNIQATSHYLPLEASPFYESHHDGRDLPVSKMLSETIIRLPLYVGLTPEEIDYISDQVIDFYATR